MSAQLEPQDSAPRSNPWDHLNNAPSHNASNTLHDPYAAVLDTGIAEYIGSDTDTPAGQLRVTQTGVLTDTNFVDEDEMKSVFPDAVATSITSRMWVTAAA